MLQYQYDNGFTRIGKDTDIEYCTSTVPVSGKDGKSSQRKQKITVSISEPVTGTVLGLRNDTL